MGYCIKKIMVDDNGKKTHVLMNNGLSEVLEFKDKVEAEKLAKLLSVNSDSGWSYVVIKVGNYYICKW